MRRIFVILMCVSILPACKHQSDSDNADVINILTQDLTGAWLYTTLLEINDISSGDFQTVVESSTFQFLDSGEFIEVRECIDFGEQGFLATKTANSLDFNFVNESAFFVTGNGRLTRSDEYTDPFNPDIFVKRKQTLSKISDEIEIDNGSLELIGPVTVTEEGRVCVSQQIGSVGNFAVYDIFVPFDTSHLSLRIRLRAELIPGSYEFIEFSDTGPFSDFNISSNSDQFVATVGTNGLFPATADIVITDSSLDSIEGSFSFIGIDGGNYSGTFQLIPIEHPL